MGKKGRYQYLISFNLENEEELEIATTLKGKENIKSYLIEAIALFENGEKESIERKRREVLELQNLQKTMIAKVEGLERKMESLETMLATYLKK